LALGVDGGGTKTLAWLAEIDDQGAARVVGRGLTGSSNQVAEGQQVALDNLTSAIDQARAEAKLPAAPIASAVFALAGSGTAKIRRNVLDFATNQLRIELTDVIHDGQAVLQAGTPDGWGVALIAGTGAVAYGADRARRTAVVGGWGYWFGDEGSAYWIGQSALRAISQANDGRAAPTALTTTVLGRLRVNQPRELINALNDSGNPRQTIAELADLVYDAAEQQDQVAGRIVGEAARHWSQHIKSLLQQLHLGNRFPLALAGGVLGGSPIARNQLQAQLEFHQLSPSTIEFVAEPVAGCLQLACAQLQSHGS